jgi:hypothetical protein
MMIVNTAVREKIEPLTDFGLCDSPLHLHAERYITRSPALTTKNKCFNIDSVQGTLADEQRY